ncbi:MAG TPA: hypothetical protein PK668_01415 [Myxococcota bacterium]|nr:hypothetical protein [Myxococcota bacterium]HRY96761.1 hypothetical protein [Myxococcota bacterium]
MRSNWMIGLALVGALLFLGAGCDGGTTTGDGGDGNTNTDGDGDGGQCPTLCSVDGDCCEEHGCVDGFCLPVGACPTGCNKECDKAAGQVCDQGTKRCIQGAPPLNCQTDCNCFTDEVCDQGACVAACQGDEDCAEGLECRDSLCRPAACATREECVGGAGCMVCKNQECVSEPAVCAGDADCCVGRRCNFGTCVPVETGCLADNDCTEVDFPRCVDGSCVQECVNDIDCLQGQACVNTHCESVGCSPESCAVGEWCDTGDGICKPGCDSNSDCITPNTCNYQTHACGQTDCCGNACQAPAYCDTLSCACAEPCVRGDCVFGSCTLYPNTTCDAASNKCVACPANFTCNAATGQCVCTDAACPAGSTCNEVTGMCEAEQGNCVPACVAPEVCGVNDVCAVPGGGGDGDPCFADAECDATQGFLCDGSLFCIGCMLMDETFVPEFVCREECSLLMGTCSNGAYSCNYRHLGLKGLCVP